VPDTPRTMPDEPTTPDLVALARRPFEAFNRRDFDTMVSVYDPDAVYDQIALGLGVLQGRAAILRFFEEWIGVYADFEVELDETSDLGNGVTLVVAVLRGRPADSGVFVKQRFAAVATWRDGLIERVANDTDIDEARAAAERLAKEQG
jgi:ketosteroid isomerase-like protein